MTEQATLPLEHPSPACGTLTVSDSGTPLTLDTRWAVKHASGTVTGLLTPRGILRWQFGTTACLSCGATVADHVGFTRA